MNKIEIKELKGELKYRNTIVLTYKIEYPQIVQSNYRMGKKAFNRYNQNKVMNLIQYIRTELYKGASELYEYNSSMGYPVMIYEVVLESKITYNNDNIISLYYDQYEFTGGAHGSTVRTSQTWDLRTGKQLKLSYFSQNNPYYIIDILKNIINQIKKQIEAGNNIYFENYFELVLETFKLENYYLTENGIVIYFQQYDIGPYSSGIIEFLL